MRVNASDHATRGGPVLVFVFGPNAVGKMRVAVEVGERTGFVVLHNHITIDFLTEIFPFGSPQFKRLNDPLKTRLVEELADAGKSVIMTGSWRLDVEDDKRVVDSWCAPFRERGGGAYFVELRADLETRLLRNRTPFRAERKKVDWATNEVIIRATSEHRFESRGDFPYPDDHVIIETTRVEPDAAATRIIERFALPQLHGGSAD
jgi:hypothetical protein